MNPIERACLYGIGLLLAAIAGSRAAEAWIAYLTRRYWARKRTAR